MTQRDDQDRADPDSAAVGRAEDRVAAASAHATDSELWSADWPRDTNKRIAFARGLAVALTLPGLILLASCSGFGALARDAGLTLGNAVTMMTAMFALPAQVVLTDQLARGGALLAGAFAVTLTGIRMLPMAVVIMPFLREEKRPGWRTLLAVHGVAVTAWIEGMRRLPHVPQPLRLTHFMGISLGLIAISTLGTIVGFLVAGVLPPLLAAVLLFLTPVYFMISMLATARARADFLAIGCGAAIGPLAYVTMPGFDLLAAGLVGGTIAHFVARYYRDRASASGDLTGGTP